MSEMGKITSSGEEERMCIYEERVYLPWFNGSYVSEGEFIAHLFGYVSTQMSNLVMNIL